MSEEVKELNDGTFSGLKKTIIGTLGTLVTAGGVWVSTTLFNGGEEKEETKTEQVAAPAPVVVNIQNTNLNSPYQSTPKLLRRNFLSVISNA